MRKCNNAAMQENNPSAEDAKGREIIELDVGLCHGFKDHPYHVTDDEDLQELARSIASYGILAPLLVRPSPNGGYEMISGHRRHAAAIIVGLKTIPCIVQDMDNDAAVILMVDSNQQREHILPSERAFAYKMKLAAIKHQGKRTDLTSDRIGPKSSAQFAPKLSTEAIGSSEGISKDTVKRYIRLTYLNSKLLEMVDNEQIALSPAVELSYLTKEQQGWLLDAMEMTLATPSYSQAVRMHAMVKGGTLTIQDIYSIMREQKANQKEQIHFRVDVISKFFPSGFSVRQIEAHLLELLKKEQQELAQLRDEVK